MNDTSPEVEKRLREMYMARSPLERLRMGSDMFTAAKQLAAAGIRFEQGELDEKTMKKQLFLRFYGSDFTEDEKARILAVL
jgi:hypothetical protein